MVQNRVREYRQKAGLSQAELARRSHVASPNLSGVERGDRLAWPKLRRRLAKVLKVPEAELFPLENTNV